MENFDTPTMARIERGIRVIADGPRLALHGDLDIDTAPVLLDVVFARLADCGRHGMARLEIDCARLDFCDSSGLAALLLARQRSEEAGVGLSLRRQPEHLRHLLELTGIRALFPPEHPPDSP